MEFDERSAFLREVIDAPENDDVRLIYADWLQEAGDPRGEFIRVQCEMEQVDRFSPRFYDASDRCRQLLHEHRDAWTAELHQDVNKAVFRRGFIETITMRTSAFIKDARRLFQLTPLAWVRINYLKGAGERLAACEALGHVRNLDLSDLKTPATDVLAVLRSKQASPLQGLNLSRQDYLLNGHFAEAIGQGLRQLRHLDLTDSRLYPGFWSMLSSSGACEHLEHLALGDEFGSGGISGASELHAPRLISLKIRGRLRVRDVEQLPTAPSAQIRTLDLLGTRMPAAGFEIIGQQRGLDAVEVLDLRGCELGPRAAAHLFQGDRLGQCRRLFLSAGGPAIEANRQPIVQRLADHEPLKHLEWLHAGRLNDAEIAALCRSPHLAKLRALRMVSGAIGREAGEAAGRSDFSRIPRFAWLERRTA